MEVSSVYWALIPAPFHPLINTIPTKHMLLTTLRGILGNSETDGTTKLIVWGIDEQLHGVSTVVHLVIAKKLKRAMER